MEFASFKELIKEEVERRAGETYHVRINEVMKNNGVVLSGLTVMQEDSNISPTIYLNNYYEAYENGQTTLGFIINDVMDVYNKNRVNRKLDMRYFLNYESIKSHIVLKLINTEKNKVLLKDVPHVEFLDLSIVFQCLMSDEHIGAASVLIHNAHAKLWGVDSKELYRRACENTPGLLPYEIKNMSDMLEEIMYDDNIDVEEEKEDVMREGCENLPMYVLTNKRRTEGAACMLYPNLIDDFSKAIDRNLYIIPSSVHEILLMPADDENEIESLKAVIKEVNETQLLTEEILSDSLYFYDRSSKKFKIF